MAVAKDIFFEFIFFHKYFCWCALFEHKDFFHFLDNVIALAYIHPVQVLHHGIARDFYHQLSLPLSAFLSLCLTLSLYLSISFFTLSLSAFLSLCLTLSLSLSISHSPSLSLFIFLSFSTLSLSVYLSLSFSIYLSLSFSLSVSFSVYLSLFFSFYLSKKIPAVPSFATKCLQLRLQVVDYTFII